MGQVPSRKGERPGNCQLLIYGVRSGHAGARPSIQLLLAAVGLGLDNRQLVACAVCAPHPESTAWPRAPASFAPCRTAGAWSEYGSHGARQREKQHLECHRTILVARGSHGCGVDTWHIGKSRGTCHAAAIITGTPSPSSAAPEGPRSAPGRHFEIDR